MNPISDRHNQIDKSARPIERDENSALPPLVETLTQEVPTQLPVKYRKFI